MLYCLLYSSQLIVSSLSQLSSTPLPVLYTNFKKTGEEGGAVGEEQTELREKREKERQKERAGESERDGEREEREEGKRRRDREKERLR